MFQVQRKWPLRRCRGSGLCAGVEEVASAPDQAKFACNICKINYTLKRYLTCHLKSHDANAKDARCSDCNTYFKDRQSLLQNNFKKHQPIISDVFGNLFKSRRDLETHLRKYHCEDLDKTMILFVHLKDAGKLSREKVNTKTTLTTIPSKPHINVWCVNRFFFPGIIETCIREFALVPYTFNAILVGKFSA